MGSHGEGIVQNNIRELSSGLEVFWNCGLLFQCLVNYKILLGIIPNASRYTIRPDELNILSIMIHSVQRLRAPR